MVKVILSNALQIPLSERNHFMLCNTWFYVHRQALLRSVLYLERVAPNVGGEGGGKGGGAGQWLARRTSALRGQEARLGIFGGHWSREIDVWTDPLAVRH